MFLFSFHKVHLRYIAFEKVFKIVNILPVTDLMAHALQPYRIANFPSLKASGDGVMT